MARKVVSILAGAGLFIALVGISVGFLARSGITPIGRFIQSAFREGSAEGFGRFVASDEGFALLSRGVRFMKLVILPVISIAAGFFTGWVSKNKAWLCSIVAVGPVAILTVGYSSLTSVLSVAICILFAAISGYVANVLLPAEPLRA